MAPREIHPTLRKSSESNGGPRTIMGVASITKWRKSFQSPARSFYIVTLSMLALFRRRSMSVYLLVLINGDFANTFCSGGKEKSSLLATLVLGVNKRH